MQWELEDLKELIDELEERFGSIDDTDSHHGRIEWRSKHYARDHSVDPVLPKPYENGFRYQTDALRQKAVKLKSRLRENPFRIQGEPTRDTATARKNRDQAVLVLNQGFDEIQKRESINLLSALADGVIRKCYGVLSWCIAEHIIPGVPEREYLEELPDDEGEAKRYEEAKEEGKPKYRQTSDDLMATHRRNMARAGFPWFVEVIPPEHFMFVEDRSLANGLAIAVVRREVPLLSYVEKRKAMALSVNDANPKIPIYGERDAPSDDNGGHRFRKKVTVYQVWTREEFYELCDHGPVQEIVDSFTHPYGMPPFAIAYGNVNENETDLVRKYEPALEGVYREKPAYDYWMSLYYTMAESNAMPLYVLVSQGDGMPMLNDDGTPVVMSRDSMQTAKIPDGYKLEKFTNEINEGFARLGDILTQNMEDASPSAGDADVSASTQPWAIRLQQAMANVEPKQYLDNIANALDICVTNVAKVLSMPEYFADGVAVYARVQDNKVNKREIISLEPQEIESLDFSVEINPTSAAEQITKEQFGMEKLDKRLITPEEYIADFEGKPNAGDVLLKRKADWYYEDKIFPLIFAQEAKRHFGQRFVLDQTSGDFIGPDGQPATPEQVLMANGQQPQMPPEMTQTTMPQMGPVQAPGTMPMQGPVGVM